MEANWKWDRKAVKTQIGNIKLSILKQLHSISDSDSDFDDSNDDDIQKDRAQAQFLNLTDQFNTQYVFLYIDKSGIVVLQSNDICFCEETRKCKKHLKYLEIGRSVIKRSDSWKEATWIPAKQHVSLVRGWSPGKPLRRSS